MTIVNAVSSTTNSIFRIFSEAGSVIHNQILPACQTMATRLSSIWKSILPFIEMGAKALTTRLGTGIICVLSSLSLWKEGSLSKEFHTRILSVTLSTLSLAAGVYLIATSRVFPIPSFLLTT